METSPPLNLIQAEEVCEYTFKVELIEKDKLLLVVFNTTTGIKYQTYIEEYSDIWESLKINFQHNFSLFYKTMYISTYGIINIAISNNAFLIHLATSKITHVSHEYLT